MDPAVLASMHRINRAVDELRASDWGRRHERLQWWRQVDFAGYCRLLGRLGPDEALNGVNEAPPPSYLFGIIALADRQPKRQLTLEEAFERTVRRRME